MQINQTTKFDIGQRVFFVERTTSYEEIPCTHCGGNYREIVNNIEYTCPYCKGGRERRRIDNYRVHSGVITNIRIAVYGVDKFEDINTGKEVDTNIKYSVTKNHTEFLFDHDGDSRNLHEGELYETEDAARAVIKQAQTITVNKEGF